MSGYFNKFFFEYYLAYSHKHGISREKAKFFRPFLKYLFERAGAAQKVEDVFDLVIERARAFEMPPPPPRVPPTPPPPTPEPPPYWPECARHSVRATESIEDYTEFVYDPSSKLAVDEQMQSSFGNRMLGIDWHYYLQHY